MVVTELPSGFSAEGPGRSRHADSNRWGLRHVSPIALVYRNAAFSPAADAF